jgi:hypothetical protein
MPSIARADTIGSLLRPAYPREAWQGRREGRVSDAELHTAETRAVRGIFHPGLFVIRHLASGSERSWNFTTLLVVPLPVSRWKGVLVE